MAFNTQDLFNKYYNKLVAPTVTKLSSFVQQNPTPAGFLQKQYEQRIVQPQQQAIKKTLGVVGKTLQKVPQAPMNIGPTVRGVPVFGPIQQAPGILTGAARSYGRTAELLSKPNVGQELLSSAQRVIKEPFKLENFEEPAVETLLNVPDFLPGGFLFAGGVKAIARQGIKEAGEKAIKELASAKVAQLSKLANNSLENSTIGLKPEGIKRAMDEIKAGKKPPVKYRVLEDGKIAIEDGRHHLEAARQMGITDYPVENVTRFYAKGPGAAQVITSPSGNKYMVLGADYMGVNAKGLQDTTGLRHIEGQDIWAVRPNAASWMQKNLDKGVNKVIFVSNVSTKGVDTNPMFWAYVKNVISKVKNGDQIVARAEKMFPDDGFKQIAWASKKAGKNMEALRAAASESEGLVSAGKVKYVATIRKLVKDNEHSSYPVKVYVDDVMEIPQGPTLNSIAQEAGGIKSPHLRMRSNNLILDENQSLSLQQGLARAKPLRELPIERQIGITPSTVNPAMAGTKFYKLTSDYKKAWAAGDFTTANALKKQMLDLGTVELRKRFNLNPEIQLQIQPSSANYFSDSEPTLIVRAVMPKGQEGTFIRKIVEQGKAWGQDTIHISEMLPKLDNNAIIGKEWADGYVFEHNIDFRFARKLSDLEQKIVSEKVQSLGLAGDTFHADSQGINLYNISKFKSHGQFLKEVDKIKAALEELNLGGGQAGSKQGLGTIERIDSTRRLLVAGNPDSGATRTYQQLGSYVSPAERQKVVPLKGSPGFIKIPGVKETPPIARGVEQPTVKLKKVKKLSFPEEMDLEAKKPVVVTPKPQPAPVSADQAAQEVATLRGGAYTGEPADDVVTAFRNWVNSRRASKLEGLIKKKEFTDLDQRGFQGILDFQAGNKTGRFGDVKKYFDDKYDTMVKEGVDIGYKQDYLPQLWANTDDEIAQVFGRTLSQRPSFTMESLLKNYEEGVKAGLTPRYSTVSDLVGWYEQRANKALADTKFFSFMAENGMLSSKGKAPVDWTPLNTKTFPARRIKTSSGVYSGEFYTPPELAEKINNYLANPALGSTAERNLAAIANYVSTAKNRMLSFGLIPKTAFNFHGFNVLARSGLVRGPKGLAETFYWMANPDAAGKYVSKNLENLSDAVHSGLTASTHEFTSGFEATTLRGKFGKKWNELYEQPLFEKLIVGRKLKDWEVVWKDYAKSMPVAEAKHEAAKFINTMYGGINIEELGRNRNVQNLFRTIALTPDWLESNIRIGGNFAKSLFNPRNPKGAAYRKALANFLAGYVGLNMINRMTSGHWMAENDPGHAFELEIGYTAEGQKRYWRPYGTAVDFIRLPTDIVIGALQGDFSVLAKTIRNRLSVLAGPTFALISNVNWKGQPIYGKDKYGKPIPVKQQLGSIGDEALTMLGFPAFAQSFIDSATGKQGIEQGITQGFELPMRYSGGYFSPADKKVADTLGVSGKERYDLANKLKDQAAFGEKQMQKIQTGGQSALDTIIQERADKKLKADTKKAYEEGTELPKGQPSSSIGGTPIAGTPYIIPKLKTTTSETLNKEYLADWRGELTTLKNDVMDALKAGQITEDQAEKAINQINATRLSGGTKKPKKPSFKIKAIKIPKIKVAKIKKMKVKKLALKSYKIKVPKIKKSKIKTTARLA